MKFSFLLLFTDNCILAENDSYFACSPLTRRSSNKLLTNLAEFFWPHLWLQLVLLAWLTLLLRDFFTNNKTSPQRRRQTRPQSTSPCALTSASTGSSTCSTGERSESRMTQPYNHTLCSQRTGQIRVLSFKVAITIMCKGPLEEKYRCKLHVTLCRRLQVTNIISICSPNMKILRTCDVIHKPFNNDILA